MKKISKKRIIVWICSIFLILSGFTLSPFSFSNILLIIAGFLIIPDIKLFENIKFKGFISLLLFIIATAILPADLKNNTYNNNTISNNYALTENIEQSEIQQNNNFIDESKTDDNIIQKNDINIVQNAQSTNVEFSELEKNNNQTANINNTTNIVQNEEIKTPENFPTNLETSKIEEPNKQITNTNLGEKVETKTTKEYIEHNETHNTDTYESQDSQTTTFNTSMVWVGDTGTKYHNKSCRTLKGNGHEIPLEQALAEGREACKVCH